LFPIREPRCFAAGPVRLGKNAFDLVKKKLPRTKPNRGTTWSNLDDRPAAGPQLARSWPAAGPQTAPNGRPPAVRSPPAAGRGPAVAGASRPQLARAIGPRSAAAVVADEVKSHVFHKQYGIFFYENLI